ncbi:MAG: hypothetical protein MUF32_00405 [Burkholderiaceae bacterium]|nr:hypothetical protein [Burkholderiaceae bacterium]
MLSKNLILVAASAAAAALPLAVQAASSSASGAGNLSTTANVNFSVVIPRFIYLRVGDAASVNTLTYSPTVADLVGSTAVQATGGDTGPSNSNLTVVVLGNAGNLTLAASNLTQLTSGGNNIPTTTLTASNPTGSIVPPAFNGSTALTAVANIVNQTGSWRYTWANPASTVYPSGTYNGTVTYTLSAP